MAFARCALSFRLFSSTSNKLAVNKNPIGGRSLVEKVAVTNDGKTIVAWHPDADIPYELTKPIPKAAETTSSSLLKEETIKTAMQAFKDKKPEVARKELMNLTHTTMHRWFPRARDKKAKKTPMDRPYL